MEVTNQDFREILSLGIQLSLESDEDRILPAIVEKAMAITHCDGGALYVYRSEFLHFRVLRVNSLHVRQGAGTNQPITLPPVPYKQESVCAYAAIRRKVVNIPNVYHCMEFGFTGPGRYDELLAYHTQSVMVIPMENNKGELIGVLQLINAQDQDGNVIRFSPQYEIVIRSLGCLGAIELSNVAYVKQIKEQLHSFVEAMSMAIDERSPYNGNHTRRVARYAQMIARKVREKHDLGQCELEFDQERMEKIQLAALLHDIGKLIVPRSIMNRATRMDKDMEALEQRYKLLQCLYENDCLKGYLSQEEYRLKRRQLHEILQFIHRVDKVSYLSDQDYQHVQEIAVLSYVSPDGDVIPYLTDQERAYLSVRKGTLTRHDRKIMEGHVVMTAKILSKVQFGKDYQDVPRWAGEHHEFLDGSGYPNHLTAERLDPETRILTIADVYDALTSPDRPYKDPMSPRMAFRVLHDMAQAGKVEGRFVNWLEEAVMEEKTMESAYLDPYEGKMESAED